MIKTCTKTLILSWTLCLSLLGGMTWAQEPLSAPAEAGAIPSPRIVTKAPRQQNRDLLQLVEEAIEVSSRRYLVANEHSPWQIYHGLGALRREFLLDTKGELVSAIDWISTTNPQFRGTHWFEKTVYGGRAQRYTVPYHFEGHPNQSMALMVMCNLPRTHTFMTPDGPVTMTEMINHAKVDLNPQEELTWTLWFLTHYLPSDETWLTRRGETWSIERLVQDQIRTEVTKAACGGTHNLYSLSVARNNHVRQGGTIRGVWLQADQKIKRYMVAARSLQRRDGSFPTHYFRGYGNPRTFSEQIASTGHMMEWLMVAVDDRQFSEEWVERGIRYVAQKLIDNRSESAECGPLYHTVSALALYRDRAKGLAWPNPDVQATNEVPGVPEPVAVMEIPLPEAAPSPVATPVPAATPVVITPQTGANPEVSTGIKVTPGPSSVVDQSVEGKLAVGMDSGEMEMEFVLPEKTASADDKSAAEKATAENSDVKPKTETADSGKKPEEKTAEKPVEKEAETETSEVEIIAAPEDATQKK